MPFAPALALDCWSVPDVYVDSTDEEGRPTLALMSDPPAVDIIVDRLKLASPFRESNQTGVSLDLAPFFRASLPRILEVLASTSNACLRQTKNTLPAERKNQCGTTG